MIYHIPNFKHLSQVVLKIFVKFSMYFYASKKDFIARSHFRDFHLNKLAKNNQIPNLNYLSRVGLKMKMLNIVLCNSMAQTERTY